MINYEIKTGFLSNGEKIILFRRESLGLFFEKIPILFEDNQVKIIENEDFVSEPNKIMVPVKLYEITDVQLLNLLNPLLEKNRVLEAVEICIKYYQDKFTKMSFKDWFNLIESHYKKII